MLGVVLQFGGVELLPLAFLGVFLLVGLSMVGYGLLSLRTYATMKATTPTDVHSVDAGAVEVEGEAKDGDRTLEAPFSGEDCLAYEFEVEEYQHDDDGSNWHTRATGTESVPFRVADDTGAVGVDPAESSLSLERDYRVVVGHDEELPERVRAFVDGRDDLDHETGSFDLGPLSLATGDKQRFTERRLDPGMETFVTGVAETATAVAGATPSIADGGDGGVLGGVLGRPFVVADAGEGEAQWRYLKRGIGAVAFGAVFAAVPAFVVYSMVGA
ncbi:hypothetical protein G9C85_03790 [Halorubellus sp. JP-L1]|uniref:GIDE domain-containing protein n=1 Tax=Halorubellus sp. JP-L1 TaxID=2715753 RepID=UPI00140BCA1B|nr:GIDE domain-containing protein [Halorubellus sp. JP-L1]NHN40757.1 hypothetical protein [Halorubellus sp. JP-L1]